MDFIHKCKETICFHKKRFPLLTDVLPSDTIREIESLAPTLFGIGMIEARYSSVPFGKAWQPSDGKGTTAEAREGCLNLSGWLVREHLPDCHIFCEALSVVTRIFASFFPWTA